MAERCCGDVGRGPAAGRFITKDTKGITKDTKGSGRMIESTPLFDAVERLWIEAKASIGPRRQNAAIS